jgi:hypothetical protein
MCIRDGSKKSKGGNSLSLNSFALLAENKKILDTIYMIPYKMQIFPALK